MHSLRGLAATSAVVIIALSGARLGGQAPGGVVATNLPELLSADVLAGATAAVVRLPVGSCSAVRLQVIAPVPDASLSVRDGANQERASVALGNVEFVAGAVLDAQNPLPGGIFNTTRIAGPFSGDWTANFTFPSAPDRTSIQVSFYCESRIGAGLVLERTQFVTGEDVAVGLLVLDDVRPVVGVAPSIVVTALETGISTTLPTSDDGVNPDSARNDGLYSAEYVFPAAGAYDIVGTVDIATTNGPMTRRAKRRVTVADAGLEMGNVTSALTRSTAGCLTGLSVRLGLDVLRPGNYLARAELAASTGKRVSVSAATEFASPGSGAVTLTFPIPLLRQLERDEAYQIEMVRVDEEQNSAFTLAFLRPSAGLTPPVVLGQACADPIEVVGGVRATPVLARGLIGALDVAFSLRATVGGSYTVSFKVLGASGEDLGLYTQTRTIAAGGITEFAQSIAASAFLAADGPYQVTSLLVSGPRSAQFSSIGSTTPLSRWQFLPRISGDLDNDGDVDSADRDRLATFRNQLSLAPGDRRDLTLDGRIDVLDLRRIQLMACPASKCPAF